ncbi:Transcription factor GRAS [Dillenia turbinata]|uniref:Transcription factor GRAS n=1 Tax=Dillenia turbinata TaxID=194707 RepID=A0AAN8W700_9MAGN
MENSSQSSEIISNAHDAQQSCTICSDTILHKDDTSAKANLEAENLNGTSNEANAGVRRLSAEQVMRVAGARYIQFCSQKKDSTSMQVPLDFALSDLSVEEMSDVELVHLLLAAAEKVGEQKYDQASRLLKRCTCMSSNTGNSVHRAVFYFTKALQERIAQGTGIINSEKLEEEKRSAFGTPLSHNVTTVVCKPEFPIFQVALLTGAQAILDNIGTAQRIHLIDLGLRNGIHLTVLMQSLAARKTCQIELLKITAFGLKGSRDKLEGVCLMLASLAESINLPFSFNVLIVPSLEDLNQEHFKIEDDEVVAIYSLSVLATMVSKPKSLETLMRKLKMLNSEVMVVTEIESSHNSPVFVNRFIEALFYYGAFFDALEECMGRNSVYRMMTESNYLHEGIQSIIANEGDERVVRNVKIDVWRAFFARFRMTEIELTDSCLQQARSVNEQFSRVNSCTVDLNGGRSIIVGWKGTPLLSVSAWRFS